MWIVRNEDGRLGLFTDKPFRGDGNRGLTGCWCTYTGWYMEISNYYHFSISWEDEPIEVDLYTKEQIKEIEKYAGEAAIDAFLGED